MSNIGYLKYNANVSLLVQGDHCYGEWRGSPTIRWKYHLISLSNIRYFKYNANVSLLVQADHCYGQWRGSSATFPYYSYARKGLLYESGRFYNPLHNLLFTLFDYKDIFASTIISECIWIIIFEAWLLLLSQKTNPWRAGPAEIQRKNQQKSCWKNEEIFRDRSVSNLTTSSAICHTDLDVQAG